MGLTIRPILTERGTRGRAKKARNADTGAGALPAVRLLLLATAAVLLLAGCAAPSEPQARPTPLVDEGAIDLTERLGLMLVDVEARQVQVLTERNALAWMSPNGTFVTWTEATYSSILDRSAGSAAIGPRTVWARIHDNATGLELVEREARIRPLGDGPALSNATVPATPLGGAWTSASEDLAVLGLERAGGRPGSCASEIVLLETRVERTVGCHLRIAPDGRSGWTEGSMVRVRARGGAIVNLTDPHGQSDATLENPIFAGEELLMLRVTGGAVATLTEVVDRDGNALAKAAAPRRLALHDATSDGRYVLLRVFER